MHNTQPRPRVPNRRARQFVERRQPFQGSNLWGQNVATPAGFTDAYVVFSYGTHWPLLIWDGEQWFENTTRFSASTSRHLYYTRPHPPAHVEPMEHQDMCRLLDRLTRQLHLELEPRTA